MELLVEAGDRRGEAGEDVAGAQTVRAHDGLREVRLVGPVGELGQADIEVLQIGHAGQGLDVLLADQDLAVLVDDDEVEVLRLRPRPLVADPARVGRHAEPREGLDVVGEKARADLAGGDEAEDVLAQAGDVDEPLAEQAGAQRDVQILDLFGLGRVQVAPLSYTPRVRAFVVCVVTPEL